MSGDASATARHVAAYGLPGRTGEIHTPDHQPLGDADWVALVRVCERQRIIGFLHAAVEDGALPVTTTQLEDIGNRHLRWCGTMLLLERHLLDAVGALEHAGIEVIVLKGSAAAHLNYARPETRLFGDNDLLFRPAVFDDALAVLAGLGYRRQFAEARPGFDARFGKGAPLTGSEGDELDTHCNLLFGTFGLRIDVDELFASATTFELGGRTLAALGSETRLLHACYHAALGDPEPRYAGVRDLGQLLLDGDHDTNRVLDLARQWEANAVLSRAVDLCRTHLGVTITGPIADQADAHVPTRRERRAVDAYVGGNRRFAAKVAATLPYVDGLRERAAFLRAVVHPAPEFASSHGGERGLPWLRRGARALLRGRRER